MRIMGNGKSSWQIPVLLTAAVFFIIGYIVGHSGSGPNQPDSNSSGTAAEEAVTWTCSMHPQIQLPEFGLCALCGMDLIPAGSSGSGSPRELSLSPAAVKLSEVATTPAVRKQVALEVRLAGKVAYDETRIASISAWFPGRIDSLYIDFTGIAVSSGDPLALLYSPDLLTAQSELIQALSAESAVNHNSSSSFTQSISANVDAARNKLKRLGLTISQISTIEHSLLASDQLTIHAPIGGIVTQKKAVQGMYVNTGSEIYTIADLSHVWVEFEAYETDLNWLQVGQPVEFTTIAYPGRIFTGSVEFIDPILDDRLRSVTIRVNVHNHDLSLKPGMLAQGTVSATIDASGQAAIDISNMQNPLTIPATAPLLTGKRAVVYIADPESEGNYRGQEVQLGPRVGSDFVVLDGIAEGDEIVVKGNFKIDSAIQLTAGYSMMNPDAKSSQAPLIPHHGLTPPEKPFATDNAFINQLSSVYDTYFELQTALSLDQATESTMAAYFLAITIEGLPESDFDSETSFFWSQLTGYLAAYASAISTAEEIAVERELFEPLSKAMLLLVQSFGSSTPKPIIKFHCPMAFDWRGADWLQNHQGVENPYFGSEMYSCGSELNTLHKGDRVDD